MIYGFHHFNTSSYALYKAPPGSHQAEMEMMETPIALVCDTVISTNKIPVSDAEEKWEYYENM